MLRQKDYAGFSGRLTLIPWALKSRELSLARVRSVAGGKPKIWSRRGTWPTAAGEATYQAREGTWAALRSKPLPPTVSHVGVGTAAWRLPGAESRQQPDELEADSPPEPPGQRSAPPSQHLDFGLWDLSGGPMPAWHLTCQTTAACQQELMLSSFNWCEFVWETIEKIHKWHLSIPRPGQPSGRSRSDPWPQWGRHRAHSLVSDLCPVVLSTLWPSIL